MSTTVFPDVMQDMTEHAYRQQVYIVAETQMHVAPWLFDDEGWEKSRLKAAIELVCTGKVTPTAEGWQVQGSSREGYAIPAGTMACPCKAAQHGSKSKICKHRVAVELARRVQQAYPQDPTLPIGPTTIDERLATPAREEVPMTEDPSPYIPAPEEAAVAVLEAPRTTTALTPVDDLEAALQVWTTQRAVVQRFLKQELKPNIDYYTLRIGGKESKPSLSKAGAEKVMGWLKLQAAFTPDTGTWEMLGRPQDLVAYVCTLRTRSGEIVGEGRGARSLKKDGGDINKAIKMAEKSSMVSAVIRTGCLSDVFTQDLEPDESQPAPPDRPSSADLRARIWALVKQADPTITTREQVVVAVRVATGLELEPDNYGRIVAALGQGR